jgi:hypothetical protein
MEGRLLGPYLKQFCSKAARNRDTCKNYERLISIKNSVIPQLNTTVVSLSKRPPMSCKLPELKVNAMRVPRHHAYPGCGLLPWERREPRFLHGYSAWAWPRAAHRSKQPVALARRAKRHGTNKITANGEGYRSNQLEPTWVLHKSTAHRSEPEEITRRFGYGRQRLVAIRGVDMLTHPLRLDRGGRGGTGDARGCVERRWAERPTRRDGESGGRSVNCLSNQIGRATPGTWDEDGTRRVHRSCLIDNR